MSWVTIVWSMIASACLTLAAIYSLVWYKNRATWAPLLFSLTAVSTTGFAFCELWIMRAQTPAELDTAIRWAQVPLFFWLVSIVWFVRSYLATGRLWLAWTVCGMRAFPLLLPFVTGQNFNYLEVTSLRHVQFLGESVTVLGGVPNPVMIFGQFSILLILAFVADASVTSWRRGDRRKALMVGGGIEFFLLTGLGTSALVLWANIQAPIVFSWLYLGLIAVMGYELSRDVLRASQLVRELQVSEAGLRDLSARLIAAQEVERARIARDLHDDVSQQLAGLSIALSGLKRRAGAIPNGEDLEATVSLLQQKTTTLADSVRHLSHDLHPDVLRHVGLASALTTYCKELSGSPALVVTCGADGDFEPIGSEAALCLYRIAQEALHNVVKHANARHATVRLLCSSGIAELTVADDGQGFDIRTRGKDKGIGLVSITERARFLGGTVSIVTTLNKGTEVRVRIPIDVRPAPDNGELSARVAAST
jgi:signal transduction histidine kinase